MLRATFALLSTAAAMFAAEGYQKPPKEILDVLNAPLPPVLFASPDGSHVLLAEVRRYPAIADLAQGFLGLAGVRINPATNNPQLLTYHYSLKLKNLADGREPALALPTGARLGTPSWSPDGKSFAVLNTTVDSAELLIGDVATGRIHKLPKIAVNGVLSSALNPPYSWIDSHQLLVKTVPVNRGKAPVRPAVPVGPVIQESKGQSGPVRTMEDMIGDTHDEDLFEYYSTSQIVIAESASGKVTAIGSPGQFTSVSMSPDGKSLLVTRVKRPFSWLHTYVSFPRDVEVWDRAGKATYTVAKLPLADKVPIDGVPVGPRNVRWFATEPATLVWTEALDGGDTRKPAPVRDRLMKIRAPFKGESVEITRNEQRIVNWSAVENTTKAFVTDVDRRRNWTRTSIVDFGQPGEPAKQVWSRNTQDRYGNPGSPLTETLANGHSAIRMEHGSIWLEGRGATPAGERPFLDMLDLGSMKTSRVFQSRPTEYEDFVALASSDGSKFITRRESPSEPPNYFLRTKDGNSTPITDFRDPVPQLRKIRKQLVKYKRADGVDLSFTLYLPPDYKEGTRLPTVLYAYPTEFTDASTAGQVAGSTSRATTISGISHLFYVLAGYAVLDATSIPIVGDTETVNNTYIEQLTASAKAAIDKAAEMGVTDPKRVGAIGHSYGAFMTANLLAHTDLFRAGVARSGAYNRTLTPFGFQSERRTYWQAAETYMRMSPFNYANKINEPLLLIHGAADDNQGTFPIQSERMYAAVRGHGGTVRLVFLPHEAHAYRARESVEHTLWEMITWFDKYVKNADTASPHVSGGAQ